MTLAAPQRDASSARYWPTHRFTVRQFLRMVEVGILGEDDKVELLEGHIVPKMARNPSHDSRLSRITSLLIRTLSDEWVVRSQAAVVLKDSVPEPDVAVVVGPDNRYIDHHPAAADVALLIEVSESSLDRDREDKLAIYARSGIPMYWVVNLVDEVIEEYSQPRGGRRAGYRSRTVRHPSDTIPLSLLGKTLTEFRVSDLLMLTR